MNPQKRRKALIISVSQYEDTEHLENLEFCTNDGEAMYSVLSSQGYSIQHKLVGRVNYREFKDAVFDFFRRDVNPSDTLLFYLTGHGFTDEYGDGFFCTSNINVTEPDEYGFPFNELTKQMDKSDSQSIIAILDCCHSGAAIQSNMGRVMGASSKEAKAVKDGRASLKKEFEQGQGRCVLASSLSNKESFGLADKPFSAFTYFILEGLKPNKRTVDESGCVTPEKLSIYVSEELKKLQGKNYQKPVRHLSIVDKMVLAEHKDLRSEESRMNIDEMVRQAVAEQLQERESESHVEQSIQKRKELDNEPTSQLTPIQQDITSWNKKGDELDKEGKYQEAIQMYNKTLESDPRNIHALYNKANSHYSLGQFDQALVLYDKVLEIEPLDVDTLINKALTLVKLGKPKKSIPILEKAIEIDPNNTDALITKGHTLDLMVKDSKLKTKVEKNWKLNKVIKIYNEALSIDPNNVKALIKKGEALYRKKKFLEAVSLFNKALSLQPDNVVALNYKGNVIALQEKREAGLKLFEDSIKADPQNSWTFYCKGLAHMEFEQYENAIACFDRALEIDPTYKSAENQRKKAIKKNKGRRWLKPSRPKWAFKRKN